MCEALDAAGLTDIQSMELLQVEDVVRTKNVPILDLEFVKHKVSFFFFFSILSIFCRFLYALPTDINTKCARVDLGA